MKKSKILTIKREINNRGKKKKTSIVWSPVRKLARLSAGKKVRTNSSIWRTRISCWGSSETGREKKRVGWNSLTLDINFLKKIKDNPHMTFKHFLMLSCITHNSFLTKCSLMSKEGKEKAKAFIDSLFCSRCCISIRYKLSSWNFTKTLGSWEGEGIGAWRSWETRSRFKASQVAVRM